MNSKRTRRIEIEQERRVRARQRQVWVVSALIFVALIIGGWWWTTNQNASAGTTQNAQVRASANPFAAGLTNEHNVPALQSAESGTASKPVLVWFHADW